MSLMPISLIHGSGEDYIAKGREKWISVSHVNHFGRFDAEGAEYRLRWRVNVLQSNPMAIFDQFSNSQRDCSVIGRMSYAICNTENMTSAFKSSL